MWANYLVRVDAQKKKKKNSYPYCFIIFINWSEILIFFFGRMKKYKHKQNENMTRKVFFLQSIRIMYKHSNLESFSRCYLRSHNKRFRGLESFLYLLFFFFLSPVYGYGQKRFFFFSFFYVVTPKNLCLILVKYHPTPIKRIIIIMYTTMEKRIRLPPNISDVFMERGGGLFSPFPLLFKNKVCK